MAIPAILATVFAKPLTSLLMHCDPEVRKKAFDLAMEKRNFKMEQAGKKLALSSQELNEALNKLVKSTEYKQLVNKLLDKDDKAKFYTNKGKVRAYAKQFLNYL